MTRVRVAPLAAFVLAGGIVAVAAANCASPTQIIVDVRADTSLCAQINTGIAVGAPSTIDKATLTVYQNGCKTAGSDGQSQVGALTITPSGSDDAEVSVRIVAATGDKPNPDACGRKDVAGNADWSSCILARRTTRFAPGETVTLTVRLTADCVGQYCGDVNECADGACVRPEQVQNDGGTVLDAEVIDFDAGDGAPLDAGADACALDCVGPSTACDAPGKPCKIDCTVDPKCGPTTRCAGDFACLYACGTSQKAVSGTCDNVTCLSDASCEFDCRNGGTDHCKNIACSGPSCKVECSNTSSTCLDIAMDAGTNTITCDPTTQGNPTCKNVVCSGGTCTRSCGDAGLGCAAGDDSRCSGNCDAFEDAGAEAGPGN